MSKEYRDAIISYNVKKHGEEYTPVSDFGIGCPECASFNISVNNDDGNVYNIEYNDYMCNDCGCEFTVDMNYQLNEDGRRLNRILNAVVIIFSCLTAIFLVSGVCFAMSHKLRILGIVFVCLSLITGIISGVASDKNDKI